MFCNVLLQLKHLLFWDCIYCVYCQKEEVLDGDVAAFFSSENLLGKDWGREAGVEQLKTLPCNHCRRTVWMFCTMGMCQPFLGNFDSSAARVSVVGSFLHQ